MEQTKQEELEDILSQRLINAPNDKEEETIEKGISAFADEQPELAKPTAIDLADKNTQPQPGAVPSPIIFAKVEKSLISLGFFTPSSRRIKDQKIKTISFTRTVDGKKVEATAEFHPSPIFGLPITADQDKFLALHSMITNILMVEGEIKNPIRFTSADLLRLLNSRVRAGKNYKDICEWLDVMTSTTIISNGVVYEAGKRRFARDRFHVFERAVSVGKELPDGSIADANYVWLSEWQLQNINQNFLLPIDFLTYRELKNHIAKALVPLLQIWLFVTQKAGSFEKRYDELCEILNIKTHKAPSLITQQLKPSLDELTHYEYLEKWRIERTADKKAFKIIFFHGSKFHRDRRRRLEQKTKAEAPTVIAESDSTEPTLPEPGRLQTTSTPLVQDLTPTPTAPDNVSVKENGANTSKTQALMDMEISLVGALSSRQFDPAEAMKLLKSIPAGQLEQVWDYIDYCDEKKLGPGYLHNLIEGSRQLPSSYETRREREERKAAAFRSENFERLKAQSFLNYGLYRRQIRDRYIRELPAGEFDRRVVEQKEKAERFKGGPWTMSPEALRTLARNIVLKEIEEGLEKSSKIPSYQDFYDQELPAILVEMKLESADCDIELTDDQKTRYTRLKDAISAQNGFSHNPS